MKKTIIILIAILALCSCKGLKAVSNVSNSKDVQIDSTRIEIKPRISLINIPGAKVALTLPAEALKPGIFLASSKREGRAQVDVEKDATGNLIITASCDSLQKEVIVRDSIIHEYKYKLEESQSKEVVKEKTGLFKSIWMQYSNLCALVVSLWIAWRALKYFFPAPVNKILSIIKNIFSNE